MTQQDKNTDMNKEIAKLLFPDFDNTKDRKYWENKYLNIKRDKNGEVLRLAPSPTGPLHIGTLYLALLDKILAQQSNGTFILRIEDTDTKREQEGSLENIIKGLCYSGIIVDEGYVYKGYDNTEIEKVGSFGPYLQSERRNIYIAFIYDLIERGHAYPCFMTEEELGEMREEQMVMKIRPGCYGSFAKSRDLSIEEIKNKIENGEKWIIRLRSSGDFEKKIDFTDEFMGKLSLSQNDEDFILYKSDGLPTYHLAHLVDDYLMKVTFVTRSNEWVPSITKHTELWEKLFDKSFEDLKKENTIPKYGHIMPINIKDGESVRKLSKRKDKEALVGYFADKGYPKEAVVAYLIRLMCPTFDDYWINKDNYNYISGWRIDRDQNILPTFFNFNEEELKRNSRGPLFDWNKLNSLSSDIISFRTAEELVNEYEGWVRIYNTDVYAIFYLNNKKNYLAAILDIERSDGSGARKDIKHYSEVQENVFYFYDELFQKDLQNIENNKINKLDKDKIKRIYNEFIKDENEDLFPNTVYIEYVEKDYNLDSNAFRTNPNGDRSEVGLLSLENWVLKMKSIFELLKDEGMYEKFGEMMADIRVVITNRDRTPNMYYLFRVLGKDKIIKRINNVL